MKPNETGFEGLPPEVQAVLAPMLVFGERYSAALERQAAAVEKLATAVAGAADAFRKELKRG